MKLLARAGAFARRHERAEETAAEAVGLDLLWAGLRYLLVAGAASAAVFTAARGATYHPGFSLSEKGAAFITRNEGVRYRPYNDAGGACTTGVGHLVHYGSCTSYDYAHWRVSPAQATTLLLHDSSSAASCVRSRITHPINQAQFDALVDLVFNAGCGSLDYRGVRAAINAGDLASVPAQLATTAVTAAGRYLPGLHTRRLAEGVLFSRGYYGPGIGSLIVRPRVPAQSYLPKAYTWNGRSVQVANAIRPAVLRFLATHRGLRVFAGFAYGGHEHVANSDHFCGAAVDLVPVAGVTKAGYAAVAAAAADARRAGFAYVEPLNLTWIPGNHHLHVSVRRCASLSAHQKPKVNPAVTPKPVPTWAWAWAAWTLHRAPYKTCAGKPACRPRSAPKAIPAWAWRWLARTFQ